MDLDRIVEKSKTHSPRRTRSITKEFGGWITGEIRSTRQPRRLFPRVRARSFPSPELLQLFTAISRIARALFTTS